MNPQIINLLLALGISQLGRKLDLDNPDVLVFVRLGYLTAQTITFGVCYYIATKIKAKNDTTTLKYVEPAKPFTNEPPKNIETNYRDYDLSKIQELLKQTMIGMVMTVVLHLYWGFTQPLLIQAVLPLKNLYSNQLVQIYLLGKPAEGDLKRPFKISSLLGESQQPQTDKAAMKKASKASKSGGKKDD